MIAFTAGGERTSLLPCPIDEAISPQVVPTFHTAHSDYWTVYGVDRTQSCNQCVMNFQILL